MDFLECCDAALRSNLKLDHLRERRNQLERRLQELHKEELKIVSGMTEQEVSADDLEMFVSQQLLQASRLHGISILQDSYLTSGLWLSFDPVYGSQYPGQEFYTVQLVRQGGNYRLGQYSLPPFIPIAALVEQYLDTDVKTFARQIWEHLYNYVQRREGLRHVKADFSDTIVGETETNLPVTFVHLTLDVGHTWPAIDITLHYSIDKMVPDNVILDAVQDDGTPQKHPKKAMDEILSKGKQLLLNCPIHTAVTSLINMFISGKKKKDN